MGRKRIRQDEKAPEQAQPSEPAVTTQKSETGEPAPKKAKLKHKKKKLRGSSAGPQNNAPKPTSQTPIEYLQLWNLDRDSWKFNKKNQIWLLRNMFNEEQVRNSSRFTHFNLQVSELDFGVLVWYLSEMSGAQRNV